MKVKIKKLEDRAILPVYKTRGAAGFDFHAIDTVVVPAGGTVKIRTGIAVELPEGYEIQVRPRSGLSATTSLRVANSPGTIDSDYTQEIYIIMDNINQNGASSIRIDAGDRVAQGVLQKVEQAEFVETQELTDTGRGGFGSTGK
jgi:dUTP pyrophosphatase